jgi:hypothetical protein
VDPVHLVSVDLYAFAQSTAQRLSHSTHTPLCKQSGTVLEGIDCGSRETEYHYGGR